MPNQQIQDTSLYAIHETILSLLPFFSGADIPKVTVKEEFKGMGNLLCQFFAQ